MPWSRAMLAAFIAACCAANGVPLREPRKPSEPELFQLMVLPCWSAMVTMVLLKEAWMWTIPLGTLLRSFRLNVLPFLPFFVSVVAAAGFAMWFGFSFLVSCFVPGLKPGKSIVVDAALRGRSSTGKAYVLAAAFFLFATVPLRGPLRVRALV